MQVGLIMKSFSLAANNLSPRYRQKGGLALMIFDSVTKSANVTVYPKDKYELAYEAYIREEQRSSQESTRQVVLVKMDSIQKLEKAYPNYFARLKDFQTELNHIYSWSA